MLSKTVREQERKEKSPFFYPLQLFSFTQYNIKLKCSPYLETLCRLYIIVKATVHVLLISYLVQTKTCSYSIIIPLSLLFDPGFSWQYVWVRSWGMISLTNGLEWWTKWIPSWLRIAKPHGWVHYSLCIRLSRSMSKYPMYVALYSLHWQLLVVLIIFISLLTC